jgi:P-type Cu+ transporter
MRNTLSLSAIGHATSLFFAISFVLCIAVSLIFPAHTLAQTLQGLLPGFQWLTLQGFVLGLIETYGYGWYATLIWVPIYNVVVHRQRRTA